VEEWQKMLKLEGERESERARELGETQRLVQTERGRSQTGVRVKRDPQRQIGWRERGRDRALPQP
jgi:hypothetical protein